MIGFEVSSTMPFCKTKKGSWAVGEGKNLMIFKPWIFFLIYKVKSFKIFIFLSIFYEHSGNLAIPWTRCTSQPPPPWHYTVYLNYIISVPGTHVKVVEEMCYAHYACCYHLYKFPVVPISLNLILNSYHARHDWEKYTTIKKKQRMFPWGNGCRGVWQAGNWIYVINRYYQGTRAASWCLPHSKIVFLVKAMACSEPKSS